MELLRDPSRMVSLVKKIGQKLEEKIASGEVKESELLEEAAGVVGKLQDIPGAEHLRRMFGSSADSKASQAATGAALKQRIGKAKTRERLQAKLAAKRAERAAQLATQQEGGEVTAGDEVNVASTPATTSGADEWLSEELRRPQQRSAPRRKKGNKKKR